MWVDVCHGAKGDVRVGWEVKRGTVGRPVFCNDLIPMEAGDGAFHICLCFIIDHAR